jgi:hypothetical protein
MEPKQEILPAPVAMTASEQAAQMMQTIKDIALAPDAETRVGVMREIMTMQRELQKDQAERAFNEAMALIANEMPRIKKKGKVEYLVDKNNKQGPKEEAFKFAKFEDIDAAIRPLLVKYGFSLSFTTEPRTAEGGGLTMVGRLSHKEGHFRESRIAVALDSSGGKNNIQGMGSSSSYGKRYVTCMLLNIITEGEDDDATTAEPITEEQVAKIEARIKEVGADREKFLAYLKVEEVTKIRARDFNKALKALDQKAAENKQQKGKAA